jgi:ribosomal protein S12 methylthiotransferase
MEIQKDISLEKNESFLGKKLKVLIESVEGDFFVGRSYRDAPEVDGEILINKNNSKIKIGKFYDVEINDYDEYDLFGDILLDERKGK